MKKKWEDLLTRPHPDAAVPVNLTPFIGREANGGAFDPIFLAVLETANSE